MCPVVSVTDKADSVCPVVSVIKVTVCPIVSVIKLTVCVPLFQ